ncbi:MAG: DUF5916 domain-containing protein [Fermentimonas sp.]|nr:DUF5916 domain-containing protein [Fermentimonas sp.]
MKSLKNGTAALLLCLMFFVQAGAQNVQKVLPDTIGINTQNKNYVYVAKKMKGEITLDGVLDEEDWQNANVATNFRLVTPVDSGYASQQSVAMVTYDDKALYIATIFYDTIPGKRVAESFRRDFRFNYNDNLLTVFDTFRDQTNAYTFGSSPSGAIWDGVVTGSQTNLNWDSKIEVEVENYPDKWITEIRVPFKSLRYPKDSKVWYVNFGRLDLRTNEKSAWAPVPRQFPHASPAYTGVLIFDEPLPEPRLNFSLIPYVLGGYHRDFEAGEEAGYRRSFGVDAKIGFSTSTNLDLTYNPDFAQVEVDQQQMNVDRFELFFPEKRQFFLENQDLFSEYGDYDITPFFSRRIGLDAPVLGGARFTGKIGNDFRLGFMHMITDQTSIMPVRNYTVMSMQQKLFSRSNISFMFVNKEYSGSDQFNRVAALDYNMASSDNVWTGKFFYHRSFRPGNPDKQYAQGVSVDYNKRNLNLELRQTAVGENFLAETGYVRRSNYVSFNPEVKYSFIPNKLVVTHGPFAELETYYTPGFEKLDHSFELGYFVNFDGNSSFTTGVTDLHIRLMEDFDPTHVSDVFLPAGSEYRYKQWFGEIETSPRRPLNGSLLYAKGGFYSGKVDMVEANIIYRYQPFINLSLNTVYTNLRLPEPFKHHQFWLIGPKLDVTFSPKVYLTTFVQYNEQLNNTNVNIRFQWRYKPVSDLFIVYTDNYFANTREVRNRALVVKLSYWFN